MGEQKRLEEVIGQEVIAQESWHTITRIWTLDKGWQTKTSLEPKEMHEGVLDAVDKLGVFLRIDSETKYIAFRGSGSWSGDEPGSGGGGHYEDCWTYSRITWIKLIETGERIYPL